MTNFLQVTPFLHVADLQKALDFFSDILGFAVPFRQPGYAYIHRETVGFTCFRPRTARLRRAIGVSPTISTYATWTPSTPS